MTRKMSQRFANNINILFICIAAIVGLQLIWSRHRVSQLKGD